MNFDALSRKYVGSAAKNYVGGRVDSKWRAEHVAIKDLLGHIRHGAKVLDVPVGTGRLIPLFEARGFDAFGIDISPDMLTVARTYSDSIGELSS
jgi:ubiquinone/menaquinone biosynthesis C-methylase UbiE